MVFCCIVCINEIFQLPSAVIQGALGELFGRVDMDKRKSIAYFNHAKCYLVILCII